MATVAELINKGSCGAATSLGFNTANGCPSNIVDTKTLWSWTPGAFLDPARELNEAYVNELIIDGKLDILKGIRTFVEDGNDDTIETLEDDTQELTNEGKYRFMATWKDGMYLNKALHSIKGFGGRSYSLVDRNGTITSTKRQAGGVKGFTTGLNNPSKMDFPSNSTSLKQKLMFQFLERAEMDEDYVLINKAELDFNPVTKEGVNQAEVSFVNVPAAADTTLTFQVVLAQDQKTPVTGLDVADSIEVDVNGSVVAGVATPVAASDGQYTFTVPALVATDIVKIRVYNTTTSKTIIVRDGQFYKSNQVSATV